MKRPMINESLRILRLYWGKSQMELAGELEISQSFLSEIERGKKEVTLDLLDRYSCRLDVPLSSLLFFAEQVEGAPPAGRGRLFVAGKVLDFLRTLVPDDAEKAQG